MSGWANHIEPIKGTRRQICRMWVRQRRFRGLRNAAFLQCRLYETWRRGAGGSGNRRESASPAKVQERERALF